MEITFLDVDRWHEHLAKTGEQLHVIVNGVDVTARCYRAIKHTDGIHGDAYCFSLNEHGQKYVDKKTHEVAKEVITGHMEIKPGGPVW